MKLHTSVELINISHFPRLRKSISGCAKQILLAPLLQFPCLSSYLDPHYLKLSIQLSLPISHVNLIKLNPSIA